jgi:phosphoglucomutase/phosphomannomutase
MADALSAAGPGVELVLGTDPDADRLGCEVRHQGRFVHLTGNDIAALVVHAALMREYARKPLVVVTEVTSALIGRIARGQGAEVVEDLLVGFKYVADGLRKLETEGSWHGLSAADVQFAAGAEESHGVLVTDRIRDKDAAGGAVLLAALAAEVAEDGHTLVDVLELLRTEYGYVRNDQVSLKYGGATGPQRLADLLDGLRAKPPTAIGPRAVVSAVDHRDERGRYGPFVSESDKAARNVLVYTLAPGPHDEGARVILRPSGTEPKLKVYVEVAGVVGLEPATRGDVDRSTDALCAAVKAWLS